MNSKKRLSLHTLAYISKKTKINNENFIHKKVLLDNSNEDNNKYDEINFISNNLMHYNIELLEKLFDDIRIDSNIIYIKTNMAINKTNLIDIKPFFSTGLSNSISIAIKVNDSDDSIINIFSNGTISFSGTKMSDWQQTYKNILSKIIFTHNELILDNKYVIKSHKNNIIDDNFIPIIISQESNYIVSFELGFEINFNKLQNILKLGTKFYINNKISESIINYEITEYIYKEKGLRKQVKINLNSSVSFVIFGSGAIQGRHKTSINNIEPIKLYCFHFLNIIKHFKDKICL